MSDSDETLVDRARDGDRVAFRLLLERHYPLIYRLAYRFLGSAAEAEDIAQEVCAGLARKLAGFRGGGRFTTWLYTVILNACRDHGRRQRTLAEMQGAYIAFSEQRHADWADTGARVAWLYQAIDRLDGALKETALLVLAEELSHAEAAAVLGVKESTVSWRMHEAKKRLKAMANHD